jgi:nitrogen fixation protein NifB
VFINVFKHCAHCRADAVGVPGVYDVGAQIYMDRIRVKETFSHG